MGKENMMPVYNWILLSHEPNDNPTVCDSVYEPRDVTQWNEPEVGGHRVFHFSLNLRVTLTDAQSRIYHVTWGWGMGEIGAGGQSVYILS